MALLNDPIELLSRDPGQMPSPDEFKTILGRGKATATKFASSSRQSSQLLRELVSEVRLGWKQVSIALNPAMLAGLLAIDGLIEPTTLDVPAQLKRSGSVMKLVTQDGTAALPAVDRTLVKTIVRGRAWWEQLCADPSLTVTGIAAREKVTTSYVTRIIRLAFVAPDILAAALSGAAPVSVSTGRLTLGDILPGSWDEQRRAFGILAQT